MIALEGAFISGIWVYIAGGTLALCYMNGWYVLFTNMYVNGWYVLLTSISVNGWYVLFTCL